MSKGFSRPCRKGCSGLEGARCLRRLVAEGGRDREAPPPLKTAEGFGYVKRPHP